jgi:hypothetical protein
LPLVNSSSVPTDHYVLVSYLETEYSKADNIDEWVRYTMLRVTKLTSRPPSGTSRSRTTPSQHRSSLRSGIRDGWIGIPVAQCRTVGMLFCRCLLEIERGIGKILGADVADWPPPRKIRNR